MSCRSDLAPAAPFGFRVEDGGGHVLRDAPLPTFEQGDRLRERPGGLGKHAHVFG